MNSFLTNFVSILIAIASIAILPASLSAQPADYRIEPVSLEQGVSHDVISAIHLDRQGFLWFGTMFGLIKYDGYTYKAFHYDPLDTTSLSNDDILTIYEDRDGVLWIGTYGGGLNRFDSEQQKFSRYVHHPADATSLSHNNVLSILEDRSGALWVGTAEGLNRFDKKTGCFTRFKHDPDDANSLSHDLVSAICEDRAGNLWVGTLGGGLNLFDREQRCFIRYRHDPANPASLSHDRVKAIFEDRFGVLWIGTEGGGLNRMLPDQNEFARYRQEPSHSGSLSGNAVNFIYEDETGLLWIGTSHGLNQYDRAADRFIRHFVPTDGFNNSSSGIITAICRDASGVVWVGTHYTGLYKMFTGKRKFLHYCGDARVAGGLSNERVQALHEDRAGNIWVGTVAGLDRYDATRQRFAPIKLAPPKPSSDFENVVTAILEDQRGDLWIGTPRGLKRLDPQNQRLKIYHHDPSQVQSLSGDQVTALLEDRNGGLWIGTSAGLNRYDRERDVFVQFKHAPANINSLSHDFVLSLYEDSRRGGTLWIGTYGGLNRLDAARQQFTRYVHDLDNPQSLGNDYCFALCEDRSGKLWIGTGGGLQLFHPETKTFTHYDEKDGLPNSVICGILADDHGRLWLSTNKGLSRFDPATMTFTNFDLADGLQSNMFIAGAACKLRNGELLFGGINGFNRFHPDSLKNNLHAPPVAITSFKVFDQPRPIPTDSAITLAHDENFFSFEFAALDFMHPEKNQYAYRLEGFEREWIYSGARRFANYTNLEAGDYTFQVKAANNDGVWNHDGASVKVTITPPFWQTLWFRLMGSGALVLLLGSLHYHRVRTQIKHAVAIEQAQRSENERVRKKAANDFHDELGHRLTKIALFSELVKRKLNGVSAEVSAYLDKIIDDSQRLTNETRDFIWSLDPAKDSVYEVMLYLKDFADELFDRTDIVFQLLGLAPELQQLKLSSDSKRHLTLIFKEGLTNVLKHAACRQVVLEVRIANGRLDFILRDDGLGCNGHTNDAGRGLNNMQERAQKIQANLLVVSHEHEGTKIVLSVNL